MFPQFIKGVQCRGLDGRQVREHFSLLMPYYPRFPGHSSLCGWVSVGRSSFLFGSTLSLVSLGKRQSQRTCFSTKSSPQQVGGGVFPNHHIQQLEEISLMGLTLRNPRLLDLNHIIKLKHKFLGKRIWCLSIMVLSQLATFEMEEDYYHQHILELLRPRTGLTWA